MTWEIIDKYYNGDGVDTVNYIVENEKVEPDR